MSAAITAPAARPSHLSSLLELTKPRITLFVVLTAFVGFTTGMNGSLAHADLVLLVHTLLGTALVASGTSAFNQLVEVGLDARMERTRHRPLPAGRLRMGEAFAFALALSVAGIAELLLFTNLVTAVLATFTLTSYVFAYTPLKTRSPISLLVGAVPGALPPLGGYTAAHGAIGAPGLALFAILFLWQLPHFLAIGWRHRKDYGQAGFRILPALDPTGERTSRHALLYCLALVPVSLGPVLVGSAGTVYACGALALSLLFLAAGVRFWKQTTDAAALQLFLASIGWLPLVLVLLVLDRIAS
jgi:heme o synthase